MPRVMFFFILILSGYLLSAQFSGTFHGNVNGDPAEIVLQQKDQSITGKYVETGNTYDIIGKVENDMMQGKLYILGTTLELGKFNAKPIKTGLHFEIILLGVTTLNVDFIKEGVQEPSSFVSAENKATLKAPVDNYQRDPALVGQWIKEEVINSGVGSNAASLVTVYYLSIKADGTFIQEKETGGGGSFWSSSSKREPDASGQWYTKDQVMFVKPQGQLQYVRLNQYLFHEGSLVFKTSQGKYLIWKK